MSSYTWIATLCTLLFLQATAGPEARADEAAEVEQIVEALALEPGATVADMGAGDGEYSVVLARHVGASGTVYATEIEADKRESIEAAVKDAQLGNVRVVEAKFTETGLPDACCDAILLRNVYHHLTDPEPVLASVLRSLRPGGRFLVIDFPPTLWLWLCRPKDVPENRGGHGVPAAVVEEELLAAGFERVEFIESWGGSWPTPQFGWVFRKPVE